jgi:hypothetical protein
MHHTSHHTSSPSTELPRFMVDDMTLVWNESVIPASAIIVPEIFDAMGMQLPLSQVDWDMGRKIHCITVASNFQSIFHVHTDDFYTSQYSFTDLYYGFRASFPFAGVWISNLGFIYEDRLEQVSFSLTISNSTTADNTDSVLSPYEVVKFIRPVNLVGDDQYLSAYTRSDLEVSDTDAEGYKITMNLNSGVSVRASECVPVIFTIQTPAREDETNLTPFLSMAAHFFLFRYEDSSDYEFTHAHGWAGDANENGNCDSMDMTPPPNTFGPSVRGNLQFATAGRWMVVAQIKRSAEASNTLYGQFLTAMFDVDVESGYSSAQNTRVSTFFVIVALLLSTHS